MTRLFLIADEIDPSPDIIARRLRIGPQDSVMSREEAMKTFGLTADEWREVRRCIEDLGEWKPGLYVSSEAAIASVLNFHGPLPSEVEWFRKAITERATLDERKAIYQSDPDEWVYRCYHGAELVYVGITRQGINRIRSHIEHAAWMRYVSAIEVEHLESRGAAERREAELIARFQPRFNRSPGNVWRLASEEE